MGGSKSGGLKAAQTNRERYGEDFYKVQGAKGGKAYVKGVSPPKGFAADPERARLAGAKGGRISKRGKKAE